MVNHVFDSVGSDPALFQALSQLEWAWVLMKAEEVLQSKTVDITNTMSSATVLKASYLFYIPCYITTFSFALSCFLSHALVSCALSIGTGLCSPPCLLILLLFIVPYSHSVCAPIQPLVAVHIAIIKAHLAMSYYDVLYNMCSF